MKVPNCSTHCTALIVNPFRAKVVLTGKLEAGGGTKFILTGFSVESQFFTQSIHLAAVSLVKVSD